MQYHDISDQPEHGRKVLTRLQNVLRVGSNQFSACCPAHDDNKPSLSVKIESEKTVVFCHAGCSFTEVMAAIGLSERDAFVRELSDIKPLNTTSKRRVPEQVARELERLSTLPKASVDHPQIGPRGLKSGGRFHADGDDLLADAINRYGKTQSIQRKPLMGKPKNTPRTNVKGCIHPACTLPVDASVIGLAEGGHDALSVYQVCGIPSAASLGVPNLTAAAETLRALRPNSQVLILADRDNPGIKAAIEAAEHIDGKIALPPLGYKDFNQLLVEAGVEAVRQAVETRYSPEQLREMFSVTPGNDKFQDPQKILDSVSGSDTHIGTNVTLHRATSISCRPVEWVWCGWLPRGKIVIFAGPPGLGKTTIALSFAATVSSGGTWPDGSSAEAGNVLIWSGEDDPGDTLVPRLIAAGANLDRVFFVGETQSCGQSRPFDPALDMPSLVAAAAQIGEVALLIIDPIVSAISGDSHKNSEVRRGLQPIVEFGARLNCCVLGISHFSKGTQGRDTTERVAGSLAFGAVARVVIAAAKGPDGDRIVCRAKSNIGPDDGGFPYDLQQVNSATIPASRAVFGTAVEGSSRDLIGELETTVSTLGEVVAWLDDLLGVSPIPVSEIREAAKSESYSWRTVERAKRELGVTAERRSRGNDGAGFWVWSLPSQPSEVAPSSGNIANPDTQTGGLAKNDNTASSASESGGLAGGKPRDRVQADSDRKTAKSEERRACIDERPKHKPMGIEIDSDWEFF